MHTYTALYDSREDAERVQAELQRLGIIDKDGYSLHDRQSAGLTDDVTSSRTLWASERGVTPPEDDRRLYEESLRRGGYLLTVNVDDERSDEVHRVLEASNAVDVEEREKQYRDAGYLSSAPTTAAAAPTATTQTAAATTAAPLTATGATATSGEQAIPIVQEELRVGKRAVERGGVRVRTYTVEQPVSEQVTLREEHVSIERRPVNEKLSAVDANLLQERTIEVSEVAEEAVVAKEARVVEEVVVNKQATEHTETISDTVRHTEVDVERLPGSTQNVR